MGGKQNNYERETLKQCKEDGRYVEMRRIYRQANAEKINGRSRLSY